MGVKGDQRIAALLYCQPEGPADNNKSDVEEEICTDQCTRRNVGKNDLHIR